MAPFSIVGMFDEVDDTLYAFEQLHHEILNEHAPLKQTIVRGNQVPYMTEQWRKAISRGGGSHMKQTGMLVGNFEFNL